MKKEVNYMPSYIEDMLKYEQLEDTSWTEREWKRFELIMELSNATESQFVRQKNEDKWMQLVDIYYPILCRIAKTQGGHVVLDVDEEKLFGKITYSGFFLILNDEFETESSNFLTVMAASDDIYISVKDKIFEIEFMFDLYRKVKEEDHSAQIMEARRKLKEHQMMCRLLDGKSLGS